MAVRILWHGEQFVQHVEREMYRRMLVVVTELENLVKRNLSTSSRASGPSAAGESPHADTGKLRQSIFGKVDRQPLAGQVGTTLVYGAILERGHSGGKVIVPVRAKVLSWKGSDGTRVFARRVVMKPLAPRPFLRLGLEEMWPRAQRILMAKLPDMPAGNFSASAA